MGNTHAKTDVHLQKCVHAALVDFLPYSLHPDAFLQARTAALPSAYARMGRDPDAIRPSLAFLQKRHGETATREESDTFTGLLRKHAYAQVLDDMLSWPPAQIRALIPQLHEIALSVLDNREEAIDGVLHAAGVEDEDDLEGELLVHFRSLEAQIEALELFIRRMEACHVSTQRVHALGKQIREVGIAPRGLRGPPVLSKRGGGQFLEAEARMHKRQKL